MGEYFNLLNRLVKGAEYISNPLVTDEEREKAWVLYHKLEQEINNMKEVMNHESKRSLGGSV